VSSTGRVATIGPATVDDGADEGATVGDGADESATAGLSADTGLSGCGIIDIAINVRANPVGSAIQPAHPAAGMMRRRICWSRDLGPESDGGGGASPCHSHKPASLLSVLIKTASAEGDIGAPPVTAAALLYARPIDPPCSVCMAHNPLSVAAPPSRVQSDGPWTGSAPHRFRGCPVSLWRGASASETIIVLK
jgi:hypothetical protein